jgi:hypothetical protein
VCVCVFTVVPTLDLYPYYSLPADDRLGFPPYKQAEEVAGQVRLSIVVGKVRCQNAGRKSN